jgi:hypothetical protein
VATESKQMLAMGTSAIAEPTSIAHKFRLAIDTDFHGWLLDQASAVREQRLDSIDWQHIAEELESMAAGERRALKNQLKRLLLHLLKMREQPEQLSRHGGWRRSIRDARDQIEDIFEDSPGILQGKGEEILAIAYKRARLDASDESKLPLKRFPETCPWSFEEVVSKDFYPGEPYKK